MRSVGRRSHGLMGSWDGLGDGWDGLRRLGDLEAAGGPQKWLGWALEPAADMLVCKHQHNPFLSTVLAHTGQRSLLPEFFSNNFS